MTITEELGFGKDRIVTTEKVSIKLKTLLE